MEPNVSLLKIFRVFELSYHRLLDISLLDRIEILAKNDVLNLNQAEFSHFNFILILLALFSPHPQELRLFGPDIKHIDFICVLSPEIIVRDFLFQSVEGKFKQLESIEKKHMLL